MPRHAMLVIERQLTPFRMPPLCDALRARGLAPVLVHPEDFPTGLSLRFEDRGDGPAWTLDVGDGPISVSPDDVIWQQSPRAGLTLPDHLPPAIRDAARQESQDLFDSFLQSAPCAVIPRQERVLGTFQKAQQHVIGRSVGLAVPRTVMTNDPDAARAFVATCPHGAIVKPVNRTVITDATGQAQGLGTRHVTPEVLARLDGLRLSPMIFQERVRRVSELRVAVFGTRVLAAAFDAHQVDPDCVDWRYGQPHLYDHWRAFDLPADVTAQLIAVHDAMGLQIGVADLILTPEGELVFLETNAWGQYYWLEMGQPHLPLTDALADVIADVPGARRSLP